jgi:predicted nucleotidyltransferase
MKVVGLVTEYNPFHNGHKYHIEEAKRVTGADYVIAVMSGDYVQRGTPAVIDKYSRAEMALRNGVDLVLELPVCYATGSAEYFAHGAVSLLDKLGIVDYLCFGSECGDIRLLSEAAKLLTNTPASYDEQLQAFLKDGLTYPAARLKAFRHIIEKNSFPNGDALSQVLTEPNNILGIEYMKALRNLDSSIVPVTIRRISAQYHDSQLALSDSLPQYDVSFVENLTISSATAIRKAIHGKAASDEYFEEIHHSVPEDVFHLLKEQFQKTYPITEEDFALIMKYKLLTENRQTLAGYLDITQDLADRLTNITDYNKSVEELALDIKTKNITLTRVNRALIHMLLNIRFADLEEYSRNGYSQYARVLGIKKESSRLLRKIEKAERIPIITKVAKADKQLNSSALRMLELDILAAHLYNQVVYEKYHTILPNEYKRGVCIIAQNPEK